MSYDEEMWSVVLLLLVLSGGLGGDVRWLRSTNASPLSRKKEPLLGEFSRSVRRTMGLTCTSSFTEPSIPTTDGVFLWTIVLCILSSPRALSVLFCQYGLLMLLRISVTASSFGISFPAADIAFYFNRFCFCARVDDWTTFEL